MRETTPPTSHLQVPETVAEELATEMTQRLVAWVERTRQTGLRIPFVSDLFGRLFPHASDE